VQFDAACTPTYSCKMQPTRVYMYSLRFVNSSRPANGHKCKKKTSRRALGNQVLDDHAPNYSEHALRAPRVSPPSHATRYFFKKAPATSRTSDLNTEGALGLVALASQPIKGCCIQVPFTLFIRGKHGKITLNKSLLPNGDLVLNDLI
jgi:hypothetical protein